MSSTQQKVAAVLVRGGTVVNADGERRADVLCVDGRIAAVGEGLEAPMGARTIDAGGQWVRGRGSSSVRSDASPD